MIFKNLIFTIFLVLPFLGEAKDLKINDNFPHLDSKISSLKATDGKTYNIEKFNGAKGSLFIFTCNECPYAQKWESRIAEIGNSAMKKGFKVIAINANDPEKESGENFDAMKEKAKTLGFQFPYAVDSTSKVAMEFGAKKTPEIFLFSSKGKLIYKGAVDDHPDPARVKEHWLMDALQKAADGNETQINPNSTKAIGCTIKWRKEALGS